MDNLPSVKPTDSQHPASPPPDRFVAWAARIEVSMLQRLLIIGALGIFIMFGLFLADYSISWADWYWSAMFPVFGLVCLGHQLIARDTHGMSATQVVLKQVAHWLGPVVAVRIIFLQLYRGQMDAESVALMILLVLAVTCFLAGLHFDRSFIWISAFLVVVTMLGTELETYLWLVLVLGLIAAALVVFSVTMMRRRGKANAGAT
jgi:hypothetical protein